MSFKTLENEVIAMFDICPYGPIIVSSGKNNSVNPTLPNTTFLTGSNGNSSDVFVIPGSSLKGVLNHSFYDRNLPEDLINQLFGTITKKCIKGKLKLFDAYADMSTIKTTIRYNTAINKVSQSAQNGSLNDIQTVISGKFKAGFKITNYTNIELEELIKSLMDLNDGNIFIGGRTSRGFGRVSIKNFVLKISHGYNEDFTPNIETFYSFKDVIEYTRQKEVIHTL